MTTTVLQADERIERLVMAASLRGCPCDQVENMVTAGYFPIEGMLSFHAWARKADEPGGPEWIALGGKRGPGKSHAVMAQVGIDDCMRVPGLKVLFLRKIMRSAAESLEDLAERVFRYLPHTTTANRVEFKNGSRILLGGYKDDKDIEKYLGIEYDCIVIEECTQIAEVKKDKMRGSLRTSKENWRPRIYLTTNADGIGLQWFKQMFVVPSRAGEETTTRFFDVSRIKNPFTNAEYDAWLDSLTGPLRKAWRDGDWDAFAGMGFPQWNHEHHTCAPFEIPEAWPKWRAIDWGMAAPFCCLWFTRNPDNRRVNVYREVYQAGLTDKQQASMVVDQTPPSETISLTYADPAMWITKSAGTRIYSTADEYTAGHVPLTKADNDRKSGKRKVDRLLADIADGLPGLVVFDTCTHLIMQMESLALREGTEDIDTDQEDHAYDPLKYGLSNERSAVEPKPKQQTSLLTGLKHV